MCVRKSQIVTIAHLAAVLFCLPAQADLVLNGDFENPVVGVETRFSNSQVIGTGWSVLSGNTAYIIPNSAGQGITPFGSQFLEIHADRIGQTVTGLMPGQPYLLQFHATARSNENYFGTGQITAWIGSETRTFEYSLTGDHHYGTLIPWTQQTLGFVATNTTHLLTFQGTGSLNSHPLGAIDNVRLVAVPETSLNMALSVSFLLLICARRSARSVPFSDLFCPPPGDKLVVG
ncbi:MAG: hypothetical protein KDB22_25095 [Planctomycetales bacterium]|nr:hypothetical protein [Planctomycetales bacterium]